MKIRINFLIHKKSFLETAVKSLTKQIKVTDDARSESYARIRRKKEPEKMMSLTGERSTVSHGL